MEIRYHNASNQNLRNTVLVSSYSAIQAHPWNELEAELRSSGNKRLMLAGYGSLLNPVSARRTVKDTPSEGHAPIVVMGAKRVFDYIVPQAVIDRYGGETRENERAALNCVWTGNADDCLNARLLPINLDDLDDLREREQGYHLGPVAYTPWLTPLAEPKLAFVLCADSQAVNGQVWVDPSLLPYPPYLQVCREGCRQVDADFEKMFLKTTFLGDRNTRLDRYLAGRPDLS